MGKSLKEIKCLFHQLLEQDFDSHDVKDVIKEITEGIQDFEMANHRFIHYEIIESVLEEELSSDLYLLGCFNADFIASVTGLPVEMIDACQEANAYEAVGKGVLAMESLGALAKGYQEADGYGHHFAHYDGECLEIQEYYVFRIS